MFELKIVREPRGSNFLKGFWNFIVSGKSNSIICTFYIHSQTSPRKYCNSIEPKKVVVLFNFNQISLIKYFDLSPEFSKVLMSPWTIVSYSLFHIDFFHIFWNMFILYVVSDYLLSFLNTKQFLEIYF